LNCTDAISGHRAATTTVFIASDIHECAETARRTLGDSHVVTTTGDIVHVLSGFGSENIRMATNTSSFPDGVRRGFADYFVLSLCDGVIMMHQSTWANGLRHASIASRAYKEGMDHPRLLSLHYSGAVAFGRADQRLEKYDGCATDFRSRIPASRREASALTAKDFYDEISWPPYGS
jgi:hypothetical protein